MKVVKYACLEAGAGCLAMLQGASKESLRLRRAAARQMCVRHVVAPPRLACRCLITPPPPADGEFQCTACAVRYSISRELADNRTLVCMKHITTVTCACTVGLTDMQANPTVTVKFQLIDEVARTELIAQDFLGKNRRGSCRQEGTWAAVESRRASPATPPSAAATSDSSVVRDARVSYSRTTSSGRPTLALSCTAAPTQSVTRAHVCWHTIVQGHTVGQILTGMPIFTIT